MERQKFIHSMIFSIMISIHSVVHICQLLELWSNESISGCLALKRFNHKRLSCDLGRSSGIWCMNQSSDSCCCTRSLVAVISNDLAFRWWGRRLNPISVWVNKLCIVSFQNRIFVIYFFWFGKTNNYIYLYGNYFRSTKFDKLVTGVSYLIKFKLRPKVIKVASYLPSAEWKYSLY